MSCSGLHCAGCAGGAAVPVAPLAAVFGLAWIAEHLIEVIAVCGTCAALAVVAVVALMRWADRRDARYAQLWAVRKAAALGPVTATVIPQVVQGTPPPAIERHVHFHFDPADREAARIIRTAISGGDHETS